MDFVVEEAEKSVNGLFWYITEEGKFEQTEQDIDDIARRLEEHPHLDTVPHATLLKVWAQEVARATGATVHVGETHLVLTRPVPSIATPFSDAPTKKPTSKPKNGKIIQFPFERLRR